MLSPLRKSLLNLLECSVYPVLYPRAQGQTVGYLEAIYRRAGWRVLIPQCVAILFIQVASLVRYFRLLPALNESQLQALYERLVSSKFYYVRLLAYGVKSHALVAGEADLKIEEKPDVVLNDVHALESSHEV